MNTWNLGVAGPRSAVLGLAEVAVSIPTHSDLHALKEWVAGWDFTDNGASVAVKDPWGTQVTISLPGCLAEDLLER